MWRGFEYHIGDKIHNSRDNGKTWSTSESTIMNFYHINNTSNHTPFSIVGGGYTLEKYPDGLSVSAAQQWRCIPGKK